MLFEKYEQRDALTNPPTWLLEAYGDPTYSNEIVSVDRALTVPAVLAAVTILAQDTASLPLLLYRRLDRGKERATDHPLYKLMHDEPNPEMTSMVFREIVMGHLLGWGNFYGQMIWNRRGVVEAIYPLNPANMQVGRRDGERIYLYTNVEGRQIAFRQDQIVHIPGFGFDGVAGKSLINLARNAVGLAMAAEKYGSKVFANDARPSVALVHPGTLGTSLDERAKAAENLRLSWGQVYGGASNAAKVAVLEEGMDLKTIGFPPEDAQYIETQKWTIQQFSRVFRIPPFMLGDVERTTSWGSGIEQQMIGYVTHTLRPWTVRIEQQFNKDLLLDGEKPDYFFSHLFDDLLRTDVKTRMEAYALAITNGILTRNEVREAENRLPYEGGDDPLYPLNMGNANDPEPEQHPSDSSDEGQNMNLPSDKVVQDTALNGAQVTSLQSIVQSVADGLLPLNTAKAMIKAAFPAVDDQTIDAMLRPLEQFKKDDSENDGKAAPESPLPSQPEPDSDEEETPARDITPLLMDAARRIAKRDENEWTGARKRYEDKPDKWNAWLEQFYKRDYPAFIMQTCQPFIDAGFVNERAFQLAVMSLLERRGAEMLTDLQPENLKPETVFTIFQEARHA